MRWGWQCLKCLKHSRHTKAGFERGHFPWASWCLSHSEIDWWSFTKGYADTQRELKRSSGPGAQARAHTNTLGTKCGRCAVARRGGSVGTGNHHSSTFRFFWGKPVTAISQKHTQQKQALWASSGLGEVSSTRRPGAKVAACFFSSPVMQCPWVTTWSQTGDARCDEQAPYHNFEFLSRSLLFHIWFRQIAACPGA